MQKIYTERVHLMCPNMFFGIEEIKRAFEG